MFKLSVPSLPAACLAGMETEYPMAVFDHRQKRIEPRLVSEAVIRLAGRTRFSLPSGQDKGVHLANGGKIYREPGRDQDYAITEYATPEASSPFELVRQVEAGNVLMIDLCRRLHEELPDAAQAAVFRHNVCPVSGTSWATHGNVLTITPVRTLAVHLTPHLVTKVIYAGGGGLAKDGPPAFSLAPRMATFTSVANSHTTFERPLLNTRDLSHCTISARRQHLIGFEILCSHRARLLDIGVTMLVMRMIDAGLRPGDEMGLEDPIAALHGFCADVSCKSVRARTTRGSMVTALDIQRHHLEMARANLHREFMPSWAAGLCEEWETMLNLIGAGAPDSVADKVDWAAKHTVFTRHVAQSGRSWEECRDELSEIDIRFGQLDDGIFERLDEDGLLDHHMPGIDHISDALTTPPPDTRALLRGNAVLELNRAGRTGTAFWDKVCDSSARRILDLGDPFKLTAAWAPGT
ncbi:MAG: proteasome accessory factor PafA2 family protein [Verrucomicrobiaceae bacterium]|nr:proteasome accessory factor PafA2 family protein [Verrucomicrobiaceae bacterium]